MANTKSQFGPVEAKPLREGQGEILNNEKSSRKCPVDGKLFPIGLSLIQIFILASAARIGSEQFKKIPPNKILPKQNTPYTLLP